MNFVVDAIIELKRRFHDPQLVVMGDFNQWKMGQALVDFVDLKEVDIGHTRKDRSLDKIFLNMSRAVVESGTLEPLESEEDELKSDHRIAYCYCLG